MIRRNRSQNDREGDEKQIQFRMSAGRYEVLKRVAERHQTPVATVINDALNRKFRLEEKAQLAQRLIRAQQVSLRIRRRLSQVLQAEYGPRIQENAVVVLSPADGKDCFLSSAPAVPQSAIRTLGPAAVFLQP
jgi:hypothetical protein